MFALVIVGPGLLLGAIAWGAVGVLRQRGREDFTLATAIAFYAQVLTVAGLLSAIAGFGVLVKLGIAAMNPRYSYFQPPDAVFAGPTITQQEGQDLILAAMLMCVGLLVAGLHFGLARFVRAMPGGQPVWVVRGTLIALTVLTGLAGFLGLLIGGYETLSYFIIGGPGAGQFGDTLGSAVAFLPAWAVVLTVLIRQLHVTGASRPTVPAAT